MNDESILRKVRALLAQAEDPTVTPHEAEAFSAKAFALMEKYAIDQALLEADDPAQKGKPTHRMYPAQEPYGKAKCSLLTGIAQVHGCQVIRVRRDGEEHWEVFGFQSDLEAIDMLFTSLLLQGTNALLHQHRSDRRFRTSYWYGYAYRIFERLQEMRAKAEEESTSTSTALVLADRKSEVDQYFKDTHQHVRSASKPRVTSHEGVAAGQSAANRADLGGKRVTGQVRRSLS